MLMLAVEHSHISDFTLPSKVQEGLRNPNHLPGRVHLSLSSGHGDRQMGFVQTRG